MTSKEEIILISSKDKDEEVENMPKSNEDSATRVGVNWTNGTVNNAPFQGTTGECFIF